MENMFEVALKNKFRFPFKGNATVEDLFDLSVENLDSIFKALNSQLKQVQEESLLATKSKEDKELDIKIEIIKYIVSIKLEAREKQIQARERKQQREKIAEILASKQNAALEGKSIEELQAEYEALKD